MKIPDQPLRERWTYIGTIRSDFDKRHLPRENDLIAFDSREDAERDVALLSSQYPEERYVLLRSYVTPWEVVSE